MGLCHCPRRTLAALVALCGTSIPVWAQVEPERADGPIATFHGHRVIRVEAKTVRDMQAVLALTDDVWTHSIRRGQPIDIRVSPEQFAAVVAEGMKYKILIDDVQAGIDAETAEIQRLRNGDDPAWYLNYHNYTENKAYIQALAAAFPTLCTYQVIGQSLQGREIFAIRITGPGSTASRPASLWFGGQHAREWINVPVPEYHAEQLLTRYATDPHVKYLVDHHEFIFVPIMNPDGYDYTWTNNRLWRKNRRPNSNNPNGGSCNTNFGVDLNRNWGFQWGAIAGGGSSGSCSNDTYRGVAAFSEPETQVMRDFVIANPRIQSLMDWHSHGQLVMSPWGYTAALPSPQSVADMYLALTDGMAAAILSVHGREYTSGPLQPTLYQANGVSVDWAWGARQILGLTIELRAGGASGFELPPEEIVPTCEETWPAFLVIADHLTPPACYADCDGIGGLTANDFGCFLNAFANGQSYANCDGSSIAPVLTANDFSCFLNQYANGCS
jgi:hypothetical protein